MIRAGGERLSDRSASVHVLVHMQLRRVVINKRERESREP